MSSSVPAPAISSLTTTTANPTLFGSTARPELSHACRSTLSPARKEITSPACTASPPVPRANIPCSTRTRTTSRKTTRTSAWTFSYGPDTLSDTPVIVINHGDAFVTSPDVTLSIAPGTCTELRFRSCGGDWTDWEPALTTKPWTLTDGDGLKKVWVQGRHPDLTESDAVFDSTILDTGDGPITLQINSGAQYTNAPAVTLTIHAGAATMMRLRNDSDAWGDWEAYATTKAWQLSSGDGAKSVSLQTQDVAGNVSAEVVAQIELDSTPPGAPTFTINDGAALTNSAAVTIQLTAPDVVEARFSNEDGIWSPWQTITTDMAWTLSSGDGLKKISVQTRDGAQNESPVAFQQITLDTTPPTGLSITINGGATATNNPAVTLALTTGDATEMRLQNESGAWSDWMPAATSLAWNLSSGDGLKQVTLEARDAAGNISSDVSATITLDTTPPSGLSIAINTGAALTNQTAVTLTLATGDATQMRLKNESGAWSDWMPAATSLAWNLSSGDGLKQVTLEAEDAAGNVSADVSATITLDTTPPSGLSIAINGGVALTNQIVATLTLATGDATQMRLKNESGAWSDWMPAATSLAWNLSSGDGLKQVTLEAEDAAGNISADVSATITLDTTPPTGLSITINGGASATNNAAVTLALTTGDATEMRLKNESGAWSDWMPVATSLAWNLTSGDGNKQVTLEAADAVGNVSADVSASPSPSIPRLPQDSPFPSTPARRQPTRPQ